MGLLSFIPSLLGMGKTYMEGKQKVKEAKLAHELAVIQTKVKIEEAKAGAAVEMAQLEQSATFDMDKMAIKAMDKDWKDDVFALFFFFILFGAFIPDMVPHMQAGIEVLKTLPDFILYGIGLVFIHVFGFRNLLRLFLKKKGFINEERKF